MSLRSFVEAAGRLSGSRGGRVVLTQLADQLGCALDAAVKATCSTTPLPDDAVAHMQLRSLVSMAADHEGLAGMLMAYLEGTTHLVSSAPDEVSVATDKPSVRSLGTQPSVRAPPLG